MKHKEKGYTIKVESRRGELLEDRHGLVNVAGRGYKGFRKVQKEVLIDKFERTA